MRKNAIRPTIKCQSCNENITEIQNYLNCDKCSNKFHLKCCGIAGININRVAESESWYCKECKSCRNSESQKRKNSDEDTNENNITKRLNNNETTTKMSDDEKFDKILDYIKNLQSCQNEIKSASKRTPTFNFQSSR